MLQVAPKTELRDLVLIRQKPNSGPAVAEKNYNVMKLQCY